MKLTEKNEASREPVRALRLPEVLHRVGVGKTLIGEWVRNGTFPKPTRMGRAVVWMSIEVDEFVARRFAARDAQATTR